MNFEMRLKNLRQKKGLSQKEVGRYLNISASAYGFYEQGKRYPPLDVLKQLADLFEVSLDYLTVRNFNNDTFAAHTVSGEDLTDEGKQKLEEYYELLKSKYSKK